MLNDASVIHRGREDDDVSTSLRYSRSFYLKKKTLIYFQPIKLPTTSVVGIQLCDIILGDFSHTLLVLQAMFKMRMGHYIGVPISCVFVFKLGWGIFAVLTAVTVAISEVIGYNFIVRLC